MTQILYWRERAELRKTKVYNFTRFDISIYTSSRYKNISNQRAKGPLNMLKQYGEKFSSFLDIY